MAGFRHPGPICIYNRFPARQDGISMLFPTSIPGPLGFRGLSADVVVARILPAISGEDKDEFKRLKGHITDADVETYVKHRNEYFKGEAEYRAFAVESDKELAETQWTKGKRTIKLRQLIVFDKKGQEETQKVFYRWVRKGYKKRGIQNVPALIRRGTTDELESALAMVKTEYTKGFKAGGFNPRPMKDSRYRYRLGTLSEHALGTAVDIESLKNAILSTGDWKYLQDLTGKSFKRDRSRWDSDPEALWKDIKELNDLFVAKVAAGVKKIEDERAKAPAAGGQAMKKPPEPVDEFLKGHNSLKPWANGFFTLAWELVEVLHAHDFMWGATFSNAVDLHHFEMGD